MTRVKICCIKTADEAVCALELGAHALGLVSAMPSGPGVVDEQTIRRIVDSLPPETNTFLLTGLVDEGEIVAQHRRCKTAAIQLCRALSAGAHDRLRRAMPGVALIQVIHVRDGGSVEEAGRLAGNVDALLLDTGDPDAAKPELGGTGRTHDWALSARIVEEVDVPVYLAGGLNAGNVGQAITKVAPNAVDLCSGVRTDDDLDPAKLARFMAAVREADGIRKGD